VLVPPAPALLHQSAVKELRRVLLPYEASTGIDLFIAPTSVRLGARSEVQPDIIALASPVSRRAARIDEGQPIALVVEVLSPSSARSDRSQKRLAYQRHGVAEYWIVDPDARLIERWRPVDERPEILHEVIEWAPVEGSAPLRIDLQRYFQQVHGDE